MEFTVRASTDTAYPQASVPIYLIHSLKQPFCNRSGCWCQTNKAHITQLLAAIKNDNLTIGEAATFADAKAE